MNFQLPLHQADLAAAANQLSTLLLNQTQLPLPLSGNVQEIYNTISLLPFQSQFSQVLNHPLFRPQLKTPQLLFKGQGLNFGQRHPSGIPLLPLDGLYQPSLNLHHLRVSAPNYSLGNILDHISSTSFQNPTQLVTNLLAKRESLQASENLAQASQNSSEQKLLENSSYLLPATPTTWERTSTSTLRFNSKRSRRKATEIDRTHKCLAEGCEKSYGSEASMIQHMRLKHPNYDQKIEEIKSNFAAKKSQEDEVSKIYANKKSSPPNEQ